jgi:hypothetical protein
MGNLIANSSSFFSFQAVATLSLIASISVNIFVGFLVWVKDEYSFITNGIAGGCI